MKHLTATPKTERIVFSGSVSRERGTEGVEIKKS
jgi:hypothetical protein